MKTTGLICILLLAAAPLSATEVSIINPGEGMFSIGDTEVEARVDSPSSVARVQLWVDGAFKGELAQPPYRFTVDVGTEIADHLFEVIAIADNGQRAQAEVLTRAPTFEQEVTASLQQIYVTVRSRSGRRTLGLEAADFTIVDNGEPQQLVTFESGDIPFTAVILLDASDSMRGERFATAVNAARTFITGMQPLDEATVVAFSDRLLATTEVCSGGAPLLDILDRVQVTGGTAINDHLFLALRALEQQHGRRVVILLSDGEDVHSALRMHQVRAAARRCRAQIYWIVLGERSIVFDIAHEAASSPLRHSVDSWRDSGARARQRRALKATIEESGGRIVTLSEIADLEGAFHAILAELRDQYALGYYPSVSSNDGSWHEVKVEVRGSGLKAQTSLGYVDLD